MARLINITTGDLSKVDRIGAYYTYLLVAPVGIFVTLGFTYEVVRLAYFLDRLGCIYFSSYNPTLPISSVRHCLLLRETKT